jgi:multisubunit Na+/H+ antiporter MnhC subunit
VTGTLPAGAKLPAEVQFAVPAGGKLQWSGEILGGDPGADPSVTPQVTTADGTDIYTFTLTKANIGQLEIAGPAFFQAGAAGSAGTLAWTPLTDLKKLRLSVRVPKGGQVTTMSPGAQPLKGPDGLIYVDRVFQNAKANEEVAVSLNYAAAPVSTSAPAPANDATLPLIIVLLVAAVGGVLLIVAINSKMKNRTAPEYDDEDEDAFAEQTTRPQRTASAQTGAKESPADAAPKRSKAALIITAAVITVAVAGGIVASQSSTSVTETAEGFTQEFSQGDPCNSATYALLRKPTKGDAKKLFDAVKTASPLRAVAYTQGDPRIEVTFCDSKTSPPAVQDALAATGLTGAQIQTPPGAAPSQ